MRARRALAAAGAAVLATVLTGCLNLEGQVSISSEATISGQQRVEMNKQLLAGLGVTDLSGFEALLNGDATVLGMTPEADAETEAEDDCPDASVEETDTSFVRTCTYVDYTPTEDDDFSVIRVGETIQFTFNSEGMGASTSTEPSAGSGSVSLTVDFPGPVTSITGTTAVRAAKLDDDTVKISGSATETYDVQIVSAATGGSNAGTPTLGEPSGAPVVETPDLGVDSEELERQIAEAAAAADDDSSTPWAALLGGLVVVAAVVGGAIFFLLKRRPDAAVAGAPGDPFAAPTATEGAAAGASGAAAAAGSTATAAPGWYPYPGDPEGRPRYWDGTSWSEPTS